MKVGEKEQEREREVGIVTQAMFRNFDIFFYGVLNRFTGSG